jgi:hypothetical protein
MPPNRRYISNDFPYSILRCIIDAFRYLSKEIAIKPVRRYFQSKDAKPDPKKLGSHAKKLRVSITPYILSCIK